MPPRGAELAAGRVGVRSIYISRGVDASRRRRGCVATRPWKTRFGGPAQPSIFASARALPTGLRLVQTRRYNLILRVVSRDRSFLPQELQQKLRSRPGFFFRVDSQFLGRNQAFCSIHKTCSVASREDSDRRPAITRRGGRSWAATGSVAATAAQAQETHKGIRDWVEEYVDEKTAQEIRIQYGGSATAENAPELSNYPDIDGFLVGGASLKPEICEIVKEIAVAKNTFAMGGA